MNSEFDHRVDGLLQIQTVGFGCWMVSELETSWEKRRAIVLVGLFYVLVGRHFIPVSFLGVILPMHLLTTLIHEYP